MKNNEIHEANQSDFLKNVSDVLLQAQKNAKTAVNLSMVYAYYEIGRMIVEEEQHGENRATYGKKLLKELSTYLTGMFGKGYSAENLKLMRRFYSIYSHDQIGETVFTQFENLPAISTGRKFYLSWSHYLKLMRIDNIDERHFYEIECVKNDWSLSELKRQYNSALYERLALSTDKDKVYRLALEGQKVETPKDAVKDPYVLEFLGLKELPEYSESELESRIIDHLQQFLLELGTGFAFIGRQVRFTFDEEHFMVDLVFYSNNVELRVNEEKFAMPEFQALWSKINAKSIYIVDFDIDELIRNAITSLDAKLRVAKIFFKIESGAMEEIKSKEALECGAAFTKETSAYGTQTRIPVNSSVKYDLVGKLVEETKLTRKDVIAILCGIKKTVFDQFKDNPEEFIIKAAALINEEKATAIIQHITYAALDEHYSMKVFTDSTIKGRLGVNAMKTKKHLYDYLVFDSTNERDFAIGLDMSTDVALYVKLPNGFYISTPVGNYNPDWAIAFYKGKVKHIYFVAETKGSMSSMQLRLIEESKIHCAREHFKAISSGSVVYDVVDSYQSLFNMVTR